MAYDYPTNFSNGTNSVTDLGSFIQYSDYIVDGTLGYAFLIIIFLTALLVSMSAGGVKKALLAASFITTLFSIYFLRLGMISPAFSWGLAIVTVILLVLPNKEGGQY